MSADLFGHIAPAAEFVDIRNQRESVADEKARLCMELSALCKTPPPLTEFGVDQHSSRMAGHAQGGCSRAGVERFQPYATSVGDQLDAGIRMKSVCSTESGERG